MKTKRLIVHTGNKIIGLAGILQETEEIRR